MPDSRQERGSERFSRVLRLGRQTRTSTSVWLPTMDPHSGRVVVRAAIATCRVIRTSATSELVDWTSVVPSAFPCCRRQSTATLPPGTFSLTHRELGISGRLLISTRYQRTRQGTASD